MSEPIRLAAVVTVALAGFIAMTPPAGAAPSFVSSPAKVRPGTAASLEVVAPDRARVCAVRFRRLGRTNGPYRVTLRGPYIKAQWKTDANARGTWTARVACGTSKRKLGSLGAVETPIAATRKGKARRLIKAGSFKATTGAIPDTLGNVPRPSTQLVDPTDAGKGAADNPYACGGCTSWAWRNRQDLPGGLGNAKTWATRARSAGFPVDGSPEVGAIAVYQPCSSGRPVCVRSEYGHVAFVERVDTSSVYISEASWDPTKPDCGDNLIGRRSTGINGVEFIHRKGYVPGNPGPQPGGSGPGSGPIAGGNSSGYIFRVGDFDGDSFGDFTVVSGGGQWAVKSGKAPYGYVSQGTILGGSGYSHMTGDMNADGADDFVVASGGGQWAVKSGKAPYEYLSQGTVLGGSGYSHMTGDMNGDGADDFVVASGGGQWAVKSGKAPYEYLSQGTVLGGPGYTHMTGDFNGDGADDFVVASGGGQWAVKSGKSPYGYIAQGTMLGGAGYAHMTADMNGDGFSDFVVVSGGGQWAVKSGKSPYGYISQGTMLGGPGYAHMTGDFNADGAADFVVASGGGQWAVKSGIAPYGYIAQGVQLGGP